MDKSKVGRLVYGDDSRDAIHVAIAPVEAVSSLKPGDHIGVIDGNKAGYIEPFIGVVDPFLKAPVQCGQKFWIFLYPNTVTTLRHSWTHPCFTDDAGDKDASNYSAEWLKAWCTMNGVSYRDLMVLPLDDICKNNSNDVDYDFWGHYESVRGLVVPDGERYIRCAC